MNEGSRFLRAVEERALAHPDRLAFRNTRVGGGLTYRGLREGSDAIAAYLNEHAPAGKPVVVYGHKSPLMLASFFGALKSGRAYAPVDIAYPEDRVNDILDQIGHPFVLSLADDGFVGDPSFTCAVVEAPDVERIAVGPTAPSDPAAWVSGDDVFYLLFTSGSTGRPKGVQMPSRCVDAFMDYFSALMPDAEEQVCFNRVPYTFDVSLFDIIPGLAQGATLFALEQECEQSTVEMFRALAESGMTVWVSTPSFVEICLADPQFDQALLPNLKTMILCGEVFRTSVAKTLNERFPDVRILNTYGPTETQAVSDIEVDEAVAAAFDPLPVGYLSAGMEAFVLDPDTLAPVPTGAEGEIYLAGDTVSLGYYGRPDLTEKVFVEREVAPGRTLLCYKTGDKGYLDEEGRLFCLGRLDFQVKLNGFRIELGDVEQNINSVPYVENSVVLPALKEGKPTHLVAHVVLADAELTRSFQTGQKLRADLKRIIPEYMVPKKIVFHESFALNTNGKVDRKALG